MHVVDEDSLLDRGCSGGGWLSPLGESADSAA